MFTSEEVVDALRLAGLAVEFWYTGGGCHTVFATRPEMMKSEEVRDADEVIAIGPSFEEGGDWELYVGPDDDGESTPLTVERDWDLARLVSEVKGMLTKAE